MSSYEREGSYGKGDLGDFDPVAAELLDQGDFEGYKTYIDTAKEGAGMVDEPGSRERPGEDAEDIEP